MCVGEPHWLSSCFALSGTDSVMRSVRSCHPLAPLLFRREILFPICRQVSSTQQGLGFPESCPKMNRLYPSPCYGPVVLLTLWWGQQSSRDVLQREHKGKSISGPQELGGDYARHFILHLADWLCGSFLLMDSFSAQESGVHVFLLAWLGSRADLVLGHHCVWCCPPVHRCIFTNSASKFLYLP